MKNKINLQLILMAVLGILATMIIMLFAFYNFYKESVFDDLKHNADLVKSAHVFQEGSENNLQMEFEDLRITWIDNQGKVLYDNDADVGIMDNHASRPEVGEALKKGHGQAVRESATLQSNAYYYAVKMDDNTVIRVASEGRSLLNLFLHALPIALGMILLMILVSIWLAHLMTQKLVQPIENMARKIDDPNVEPAYKELTPFASIIREQHTSILKAAHMRQDFTANVTHELKTPLTAISGYAELMEAGMIDQADVPATATKIRANSQQLLSLINDIIQLSELDSMETPSDFQSVDLQELCETCASDLRVSAELHQVNLNYYGSAASVTGNPDMLRELIANLTDNAIRYNSKGGYVTLSSGIRDGHAFLRVKDTGIGIPLEAQNRVFERFYRVDKSRSRATGGTGLGLAIVKHIVAIHGADIQLSSQPGIGTEITVTFQ